MELINTMIHSFNSDIESTVIQIISSIVNRNAAENVTPESRLKYDLSFDSLTMLEMCAEIESALNVSIENKIGNVKTVSDVIKLIENNGAFNKDVEYDINDYPLPKTKQHIRRLKRFMRLSRFTWHFKVVGLENLPIDGKYILCPNHQSYYDILWVLTAIGHKRIDLHKVCCLAAEMFLSYNDVMAMLGGIPVERSGNTVPSMNRALSCIKEGYTMIIFPEGTRSRDGKIHEFKGGAAKLAIDANVPLIPVRIEGAWNVFPPHRKRPKIFSWKGSYPLHISFGKP
ncbi:MAG: 1-acyl-sn-glycerol-3-phosphate acyltransferase, partial [Prevotellaceae bacterium]|nr:1-acyl-sn-glycerol-3-phosphate acyltransferase [Prevotellaceae bacterium]